MNAAHKIFSSPYQSRTESNDIYRGVLRPRTEDELRAEIRHTVAKILDILREVKELLRQEETFETLIIHLGTLLDIMYYTHNIRVHIHYGFNTCRLGCPRYYLMMCYSLYMKYIYDDLSTSYIKEFYTALMRHEIESYLKF